MGSLKLLVAAAVLLLAGAAEAQDVDRWRGSIAEASTRFGIPEPWIERVMRAESGGRTRLGGRPITSRAGAMGLMQLMPGTWAAMRARHALGSNPHDPHDNILAGTAYLRAMYDRFGYPGLFAAYNAGPARYAAHLERGRPLPAETLAYLAHVAGPEASATPVARSAPDRRAALFVLRRPSVGDAAPGNSGQGSRDLFAIRRPASGRVGSPVSD
jgi:soluble lytic murein transglycosylase-like protein